MLLQGNQGPPGNVGDKGERGDDVSMGGRDGAGEERTLKQPNLMPCAPCSRARRDKTDLVARE